MQAALIGHATHPDAGMALALAAAQVDAGRSQRGPGFQPTLGLLYLTDRLAGHAAALLADAKLRWPGVQWAGTVGVGVMASGVEYFDEPALVLMLLDLPASQFRLFSGRQALDRGFAHSALVHADPHTPDLAELLAELAGRTGSGYLFGGLASSRGATPHFAGELFEGGLSGVALAPGVAMLSRVTQGCQPLGPGHRITAAQHNLVLALDGQPALPLLLAQLGVGLDPPEQAVAALRRTLVGLTDEADQARSRHGPFGVDTRVRHLIGIDPARQGVAVADVVALGQQLAFCHRDADAARRDLVRVCAEIRDELEADLPLPALSGGQPGAAAGGAGAEPGQRIAAAVYVSCSGRGGPHFGAPSAEARIVQHALGDVPLVGFFAGGEIARHHLYGYTGVLTVFTASAG